MWAQLRTTLSHLSRAAMKYGNEMSHLAYKKEIVDQWLSV